MKRLIHIIVLTLALLGLTAPGLLAETSVSHCARGAIWSHSPAVVGVPAPLEMSSLTAPIRTSVCPDHAIVATTALPSALWRGPLPALTGSILPPPQVLAEAELPPPRGQ
ncbi:hypothetical protein [Devosia sp. A449]